MLDEPNLRKHYSLKLLYGFNFGLHVFASVGFTLALWVMKVVSKYSLVDADFRTSFFPPEHEDFYQVRLSLLGMIHSNDAKATNRWEEAEEDLWILLLTFI